MLDDRFRRRQALMNRGPVDIGLSRRAERFDPALQRRCCQRVRRQAGRQVDLPLDRVPHPNRRAVGASWLAFAIRAQQVAKEGDALDHRRDDYDIRLRIDDATLLVGVLPAADAIPAADDVTDFAPA